MTRTATQSPVRLVMVLSLGAAAGVGMARFAFGPVLPAMRADLGWSLSVGGAVQSANLGAYLVGSLLTPRVINRFGLQRAFWVAFLAAGGTLVLSGVATSLPSHLVLRVVAGLAAAILWIGGGMVAARLSTHHTGGLILGLFFSGLGTGVIVTGLLLPTAYATEGGWRIAWWAMGAIVLLAAPFVYQSLKASGPTIDAISAQNVSSSSVASQHRRFGALRQAEIAYFLYGLGAIGYMTFAVALLRDQDATQTAIGLFWVTLGVSTWIAVRPWARRISQARSGRLAGHMYLIMAGAAGIVVVSTNPAVLFISGAAFGAVFVPAAALTTQLIRVHLPPEQWTATLARFTVGLGLALTIGSTATGLISDNFGLSTGILASAIVLALAGVAAYFQPAPADGP